MHRSEVLELVKKNVTNKNLFKHCLAVEAIMRGVALELNRANGSGFDKEKWAIAGLVHDIDYDATADNPGEHSLKGAELLKEYGFDDDIIYAVKAHNDYHKLKLKSELDIALFAADPLSGLIVASALICPEKKLSVIDTQFVLNRFKEKLFAKGANREHILYCEKLGISLDKFADVGLKSMQEIHSEVGL
jgi:putative nucleotidyltransferase with HDIG domain